MPLPELLDRLSIIELKIERIGEPHLQLEREAYVSAIQEYVAKGFDSECIKSHLSELRSVNARIWDLESDIRQGKEGLLGLEEVGRRALAIRDLNKLRVSLKNVLVDQYGSGFKDVKLNHASA